jgi:hypothetical protein
MNLGETAIGSCWQEWVGYQPLATCLYLNKYNIIFELAVGLCCCIAPHNYWKRLGMATADGVSTGFLCGGTGGGEGAAIRRVTKEMAGRHLSEAEGERARTERMMLFAKAAKIGVSEDGKTLIRLSYNEDNRAKLPVLSLEELRAAHPDLNEDADQQIYAALYPAAYWNIRRLGDARSWSGCLQTLLGRTAGTKRKAEEEAVTAVKGGVDDNKEEDPPSLPPTQPLASPLYWPSSPSSVTETEEQPDTKPGPHGEYKEAE